MKHIYTFLFMIFIILNLTACSKNKLNQEYDDLPALTPSTDIAETAAPTLAITPIETTPIETVPKETATIAPVVTLTPLENVNATINVFNGWYIDDSWRRYIGEESDTPQIYYGIMVSNVSDTSFDFAIYELIYNDDDKKKEILTGTASFIEDGTKAAFNEDETSLSFTFPFVASDSAAITMQISGLDILEGIDLSNWSIPGHEAG